MCIDMCRDMCEDISLAGAGGRWKALVRTGQKEFCHAYTRAADMPSAMPIHRITGRYLSGHELVAELRVQIGKEVVLALDAAV